MIGKWSYLKSYFLLSTLLVSLVYPPILQNFCNQQWPIPSNAKKLWSFLGLAGYYRKFVRHFEVIVNLSLTCSRTTQFLCGLDHQTVAARMDQTRITVQIIVNCALNYLAFEIWIRLNSIAKWKQNIWKNVFFSNQCLGLVPSFFFLQAAHLFSSRVGQQPSPQSLTNHLSLSSFSGRLL